MHFLVNQYPLHRNAALTGIGKTACDTTFDSLLELSILVDNYRGIATQFQENTLLSAPRFKLPAYARTSSESEQLETIIGYQGVCLLIGKRNNVESAVRPARLPHQLAEHERAKRCLRGRFEHNAATGRHSRCNFMGH